MGSRIGRWVVVATLDNGQTLTKQNRPHPKNKWQDTPQTVLEDGAHRRARALRQRVRDDQRAENRLVRTALGVNVR